MIRPLTIAVACLLTALLAQPAAAANYSGTTSTGNVDTWNLPDLCNPKSMSDCTMCFPYFADRQARLHLVGAGPLDTATLEVVRADLYYSAPVATATATHDAIVEFRVNGCGVPVTTFVVTGVLIDGEVPYEITLEQGNGLPDIQICVNC